MHTCPPALLMSISIRPVNLRQLATHRSIEDWSRMLHSTPYATTRWLELDAPTNDDDDEAI
jgi:hypothetical protein